MDISIIDNAWEDLQASIKHRFFPFQIQLHEYRNQYENRETYCYHSQVILILPNEIIQKPNRIDFYFMFNELRISISVIYYR